MKIKWAIFTLAVLTLACNKNNGNNPNVTLDGALTGCAEPASCTFNYYDNADIQNANQPVKGNSRVFWYKSVNADVCMAATEVFFKASLNASSFEITSDQIKAGGIVNYNFSCACCDYILAKVVGGDVKGKRISSDKWLINASVILGDQNNKVLDTVVVNQYFTQKSL